MKKLLIVFNHPAPYKVRLFNKLAEYYDLTVIFERASASDRNKAFYEEKNYKFKTVHVRGIPVGYENLISSGVKKHIQNNHYDLIIMNGYSQFAEMSAIRYLKKKNIPYAFYINGGIINKTEPKWKRNLKTKYISGASFYLSPDIESNKYLVYYGAEEDKIYNYPYATIVNNEVIGEKLTKEEILKQRAEKDIVGEKVFVSCGQLIQRKNYEELIKVWPKMPTEYSLYIIGDGKEQNKYQQLIDSLSLKNVKLLGYMKRTDVFGFYHLCDAFVFPSKEDIYGHVINEAMSQGLPVISTSNVNSAKKLIKTGINGFLVDSLDSDIFIEQIKKIIELNCFNACIETALENTLEKMVEKHIEIIDKELSK